MKKSIGLFLVLIGITGFSMGYVNTVGPKSKTVLPAVTNDLEKAERILVDLNSYYDGKSIYHTRTQPDNSGNVSCGFHSERINVGNR